MMMRLAWRCSLCIRRTLRSEINFSRSYCATNVDDGDIGDILHDSRKKEATVALRNLLSDDKMLQKKTHILDVIEELKHQETAVPDELSDKDMVLLLTECHTKLSIIRRLKYLYRKESFNDMWKPKSKCESVSLEGRLHPSFMARALPSGYKKCLAIPPMLYGRPLVIDLDFLYNSEMENRVRTHLGHTYAINYKHCDGFHLHYTSISKYAKMYQEHKLGLMDGVLVDMHEQPFWEIFPLNRLVYLSPDAPELEEDDANNIYVIGGLDEAGYNVMPQTLARAKHLGIRRASFPIAGVLGVPTMNLPIPIVMKILLHVNHHRKGFHYSVSEYFKNKQIDFSQLSVCLDMHDAIRENSASITASRNVLPAHSRSESYEDNLHRYVQTRKDFSIKHMHFMNKSVPASRKRNRTTPLTAGIMDPKYWK